MKTLSLCLVVLAAVTLSACDEELLPCGEDGEDIYDLECATCHGFEAEGGSGGALKGDPLIDSWVHTVRGGKGKMPSWGPAEINDEKLFSVLTYCITVDEPDGQKIYQQMCANCHGFEPTRSGVVGPALAGNGRKKAWGVTTGEGSVFGMPAYHQFLCEDDVKAVVRFLVD
jgi:mono/diheme cytochrome c family protein